jgi:hypothetical protein
VSDGILKLDANEAKVITAESQWGDDPVLTIQVKENSHLTVDGCRHTMDVTYTGAAGGRVTITATNGADLSLKNWHTGLPAACAVRIELNAGACVNVDQRVLHVLTPSNIAVVFQGGDANCLSATWGAMASNSAPLRIENIATGDVLALAWTTCSGVVVEADEIRPTAIAGTFRLISGQACGASGPTIELPNAGSASYEWIQQVDCTPLPVGVLVAASGNETTEVGEQCTRTLFVRGRISHRMRARLSPVIVQPDALGPGVPHRRVALAPGQAVDWMGTPMFAHQLVNGRLITQDDDWLHLCYTVPSPRHNEHILDIAGMLLLPTRHPPFSVATGSEIETCRQRLLTYTAHASGAFISTDPSLRLELGGQSISGSEDSVRSGYWNFTLPETLQTGSLRIMSRSGIARETSTLALDDCRMLGIAIASITVRMPDGRIRGTISLDDPAWSGLHEPTVRRGQHMYWTNGMAELPASSHGLCGGEILEVHVAATGRYWVEDMGPTAEEKASR